MSHVNVLSNKVTERRLLLPHETITRGSIEPFFCLFSCTVTPGPSKKEKKKKKKKKETALTVLVLVVLVFHPTLTAKLYGTLSDDTLSYPYNAVLLAERSALYG